MSISTSLVLQCSYLNFSVCFKYDDLARVFHHFESLLFITLKIVFFFFDEVEFTLHFFYSPLYYFTI